MKHKKTVMIILGVIVLLMAGGKYLYEQHLTPPGWMTYPYDVTISNGEATINLYLSEEKEVRVPKRILGAKVTYIKEDAFSDLGTDIHIQSVPEGIYADRVYHQESQSYYTLFSDNDAWIIGYEGEEKDVDIPIKVWGHNVTGVGLDCFLRSDIESVSIPEAVTLIGPGAFQECKNLKNIKLPLSLEKIGILAFWKSGIESIELPENVKEIGEEAFGRSALKEITGLERIEYNIEYIGNDPFRGTPWEESIEEDFLCIGDALCLYQGNDEEIVIPETVKRIRGAFSIQGEDPCPIKMKKVFVTDSVISISAYSFAGQEDIEVYIPKKVESLGDTTVNVDTIFSRKDAKDCTIVTTEGSPAEAYAIEQKIPYRIITEEEFQHDLEEAMSKQSSCS